MKFKNLYLFLFVLTVISFASITLASTTISTDINTGGNLSVSGSSTLVNLFVNNTATSTFLGGFSAGNGNLTFDGNTLTVPNIVDAGTLSLNSLLLPNLYNNSTSMNCKLTVASTSYQAGTVMCSPPDFWDNFQRANTALGVVTPAPNGVPYWLYGNGSTTVQIQNNQLVQTQLFGPNGTFYLETNLKESPKKIGVTINFNSIVGHAGAPGNFAMLLYNNSQTTTPNSYPKPFLHMVFGIDHITIERWNVDLSTSAILTDNFAQYLSTDGTDYPIQITFDGSQGMTIRYGNKYYNISSPYLANIHGDHLVFEQYYNDTDPQAEIRFKNIYAGSDAIGPSWLNDASVLYTSIGTTTPVISGLDDIKMKVNGSTVIDLSTTTFSVSKPEFIGIDITNPNTIPANLTLGTSAGGSLVPGSNTVQVNRIQLNAGGFDYGGYIDQYYPTNDLAFSSGQMSFGQRWGGLDSTLSNNNPLTLWGRVGSLTGVGIYTPIGIYASSSLNVNGNTAIGTSYMGTPAPTNGLIVQGLVGVGTSTPVADLQVTHNTSSATTTLEFGRANQSKGTCIKLYRSDGSAIYASVAAGATTFTLSTTACASVSGF